MACEVMLLPGKLCYGLAPTRVCEVMLWPGIPLTAPLPVLRLRDKGRPGGQGRERAGDERGNVRGTRGGTCGGRGRERVWTREGTCEDKRGDVCRQGRGRVGGKGGDAPGEGHAAPAEGLHEAEHHLSRGAEPAEVSTRPERCCKGARCRRAVSCRRVCCKRAVSCKSTC